MICSRKQRRRKHCKSVTFSSRKKALTWRACNHKCPPPIVLQSLGLQMPPGLRAVCGDHMAGIVLAKLFQSALSHSRAVVHPRYAQLRSFAAASVPSHAFRGAAHPLLQRSKFHSSSSARKRDPYEARCSCWFIAGILENHSLLRCRCWELRARLQRPT